LSEFGVRFNILSSKDINTQMPDKINGEFENRISKTIIYLLSDKARHISIQSLKLDGYP
jgi:hypothetical protein